MLKCIKQLLVKLCLIGIAFQARCQQPIASQLHLSPDGSWVAYRESVTSPSKKSDSLVLQSTKGGQRSAFAHGLHADFSPDSQYALLRFPQDSCVLRHCTSGKALGYGQVQDARFVAGGTTLLLYYSSKVLEFLPVSGGQGRHYENVLSYSVAKGDTRIAIALLGGSLELIDAGQPYARLGRYSAMGSITHMVWNADATALAFLKGPEPTNPALGYTIGCVRPGSPKVHYLTAATTDRGSIAPGNISSGEAGHSPLTFTSDGKKLFFIWKPQREMHDKDSPEIWRASDPQLFSYPKPPEEYCGIWDLSGQRPAKVLSIPLHTMKITPQGDFALYFEEGPYLPSPTEMPLRDYYAMNLSTGQVKGVATGLSSSPLCTGISPKGTYMYYFYNSDFYIYSVKDGLRKNLTRSSLVLFGNEHSHGAAPEPFSEPVWSSNESFVLLHDSYDIWQLDVHTGALKHLTGGTRNGIRYRLVLSREVELTSSLFYHSPVTNPKDGYCMATLNPDKSQGYMYLDRAGKEYCISSDNVKASAISWNNARSIFVFLRESFALPPAAYTVVLPLQRSMPLSGRQASADTSFGSVALLSYSGPDGQPLQGILYYPSGYTPGKKYPMVVYIYEELSEGLHEYYDPNEPWTIGFNPLHYTRDGYLVLYPDIKYTTFGTGASAKACVEAAVQYIIGLGDADPSKIGLYGHSFGGFETNYIVSHSSMFAAAVSGAGVADMVGSYLSVQPSGKSNLWRFEEQQYRMGGSLYDNFDAYQENSAIAAAQNITAPLLLWAGKDDYNVDPRQSTAFYLAMRRLGKPCTLLLYPAEDHIILLESNQWDLSSRIKNWFDHYLKGSALSAGMK